MSARIGHLVLILILSLVPAWGASASDIRAVDFRNATIDISGSVCASAMRTGYVRLHNGTAQVGNAEIDAKVVGFIRRNGEADELAVVRVNCREDMTMMQPTYLNMVLLYAAREGGLRRVEQIDINFRDAREIVWGVRSVELQDTSIIVKYLSGFPHACPPHMIVRRRSVNGGAWKMTVQPANLDC